MACVINRNGDHFCSTCFIYDFKNVDVFDVSLIVGEEETVKKTVHFNQVLSFKSQNDKCHFYQNG